MSGGASRMHREDSMPAGATYEAYAIRPDPNSPRSPPHRDRLPDLCEFVFIRGFPFFSFPLSSLSLLFVPFFTWILNIED